MNSRERASHKLSSSLRFTSQRPMVLAGLLWIVVSACETNPSGVDDGRHLTPSAIIMGTEAGDAYANVGAMVVRQPGGPWIGQRCTVTLLAPTVVITAGHCVVNNRDLGNELGVTFESVVALSSPHMITATGFEHPNFVQGAFRNGLNEYDVGILLLDEPVTDLPPARLPRLGEMSLAAINEANDLLVTVGYGRAAIPPATTGQGVRRFTTMDIVELTQHKLIVTPTDGGRSCLGDSGSPYSHALDRPRANGEGQRYLKKVLATFYSSDGSAGVDPQCTDALQLGWRLDEPSTLAWVSSFLPVPSARELPSNKRLELAGAAK